MAIRIHQPRQRPVDGSPGMVVMHGGGFCTGGLNTANALCDNFADIHNGVAVSVDYRLAPEHPFPTPIYDSYDALSWVSTYLPAPLSCRSLE